jgi:hypothetical protein
LKKKNSKGIIWEDQLEKEEEFGLSQINKLNDRRKMYLNKIKEN